MNKNRSHCDGMGLPTASCAIPSISENEWRVTFSSNELDDFFLVVIFIFSKQITNLPVRHFSFSPSFPSTSVVVLAVFAHVSILIVNPVHNWLLFAHQTLENRVHR